MKNHLDELLIKFTNNTTLDCNLTKTIKVSDCKDHSCNELFVSSLLQ